MDCGLGKKNSVDIPIHKIRLVQMSEESPLITV